MKRLVIIVLIAFTVCAPSAYTYAAMQAGGDSVLEQPSELTLERIYSGCIGCPDNKVTLRRERGAKFNEAVVTYTDLNTKKQRQGKLSAYYYNNLLKLIEAQGYFDMKDEYAMGWEDSLIVNMSVTVGDKRKVIRTRNEGEVPLQLWGIYMAVDGAVAHTTWKDGK
jgi:hypothetical protein